MGRDILKSKKKRFFHLFQSTLPAWGETKSTISCTALRTDFNPLSPRGERRVDSLLRFSPGRYFNPLSPRGERHLIYTHMALKSIDFNPLSPRGERQLHIKPKAVGILFQSTLPAWGETNFLRQSQMLKKISIHSPRVGRDPTGILTVLRRIVFQSTLPAWGETGRIMRMEELLKNFNPLSPRGERLYVKGLCK